MKREKARSRTYFTKVHPQPTPNAESSKVFLEMELPSCLPHYQTFIRPSEPNPLFWT